MARFACDEHNYEAYTGKKVGRARNPVPATRGQVENAKQLFRDFTGHIPENVTEIRLRNPKTGMLVGDLDGVLYTTVRDGKTEHYIHEFKKGSRPQLVASSDGESLHIIGGRYEFTESGINDR